MKLIRFFEQLLPILFWGLLSFGLDTASMASLTIISALIHEAGHIIILTVLQNGAISLPRGRCFGFGILPKRALSYKEEILVALGGPMMNFFFGLILLCVPPGKFGSYLRMFGLIHIMTMLSNLLPIEGYDGFRIARSIAALKSERYYFYEKILLATSFFLTAIFTFISLYFIMKMGEGYWIFIIFFSSLMSKISKL